MLQPQNKRRFTWRFNLGKSRRATLSNLPADPHFWSWLAGFIDGEGSFVVAIKKKKTTGIGFEVMPAIKLVQGVARKEELQTLASLLGKSVLIECNMEIGNNVCRFAIHRLADIKAVMEAIFPYTKFKKHDAEIFMDILDMITDGKHLTIEGFLEIAKLREKIATERTKPKTYRTYSWFKNYFKGEVKLEELNC